MQFIRQHTVVSVFLLLLLAVVAILIFPVFLHLCVAIRTRCLQYIFDVQGIAGLPINDAKGVNKVFRAARRIVAGSDQSLAV